MNNFLEKINIMIKQTDNRCEQSIARILFNNSMTLSIAESCTGGLVSSRMTDVAGSSLYTKENYVTYANEAKTKILNVKPETLEKFGAVSEECAIEMAEGLFAKTGCDICLSTTGIAGPTGATADKQIGLIYIALKTKYCIRVKKFTLNPKLERKTLKYLFSQCALDFLSEYLKENYDRAK